MVLACMVVVLLSIRQLFHFERFDDSEETNHLKDEVKDDINIISHNNIFKNLVDVEPEPIKTDRHKNNNYKSNSKDPFSPKE